MCDWLFHPHPRDLASPVLPVFWLSGMQQVQLPARAGSQEVYGECSPLPAAGLNRGQLGPPQEMGPGTTEPESDR